MSTVTIDPARLVSRAMPPVLCGEGFEQRVLLDGRRASWILFTEGRLRVAVVSAFGAPFAYQTPHWEETLTVSAAIAYIDARLREGGYILAEDLADRKFPAE